MDGLLTKQELDLLTIRNQIPTYRQLSALESVAAERRAIRPHGFAAWLRSLPARFVEWVERQRAEAELSALSDRELADIGLHRSEIRRVVRL